MTRLHSTLPLVVVIGAAALALHFEHALLYSVVVAVVLGLLFARFGRNLSVRVCAGLLLLQAVLVPLVGTQRATHADVWIVLAGLVLAAISFRFRRGFWPHERPGEPRR